MTPFFNVVFLSEGNVSFGFVSWSFCRKTTIPFGNILLFPWSSKNNHRDVHIFHHTFNAFCPVGDHEKPYVSRWLGFFRTSSTKCHFSLRVTNGAAKYPFSHGISQPTTSTPIDSISCGPAMWLHCLRDLTSFTQGDYENDWHNNGELGCCDTAHVLVATAWDMSNINGESLNQLGELRPCPLNSGAKLTV